MAAQEFDLFATPAQAPMEARAAAGPEEGIVALIRARMQAMVAKVTAAERMPWPDRLAIAIVENEFRANMRLLPPDEAAALWADFDRELDRLFDVEAAAEDAAAAAK